MNEQEGIGIRNEWEWKRNDQEGIGKKEWTEMNGWMCTRGIKHVQEMSEMSVCKEWPGRNRNKE